MGFEKFNEAYFGSNLEKAKRNYEAVCCPSKVSFFSRKYPNADIGKFVFDSDLSNTGDLLRTFTKYRDENGETFDITGYLFKKFYSDTLYWSPRIWDPSGTVQPFVLAPNSLPYDLTKFKIFVNETDSFQSNFEALNTSWKGTAKDITKVAVDKDDLTLHLFWLHVSSPTWVE